MTNRTDERRRALVSVTDLLDRMCAASGWSMALATVLDDLDGTLVDEVVARSSGAASVPFDPDRGRVLQFPVASVDGPFTAGSVWLADPEGQALSDEGLAEVDVLATAASAFVLREAAVRARQRHAAQADPALMETLQAVRRAEDQVGNSIAVVLGWLRMWSQGAGDAPLGGVQIAIRRLEEVQGVIADLLRTTAAGAIKEHARDIVSIAAALREAGLDDLARGEDVLVLGNRGHLTDFLITAGPSLATTAVVTPDAWLVPFDRPDQLSSASMLSLQASGGTMAMHQRGQAAAWERAPRPAETT